MLVAHPRRNAKYEDFQERSAKALESELLLISMTLKKIKTNYNSLMLITDQWSGYMWDFYLQDRTTDSIITVLSTFLGLLEPIQFEATSS